MSALTEQPAARVVRKIGPKAWAVYEPSAECAHGAMVACVKTRAEAFRIAQEGL